MNNLDKAQLEVCNFAIGTFVEGQVNIHSNLRLEGKIHGNISCKGRIVLAKTASVEGNIQCEHLVSEGIIHGNVTAKNKIHLFADAKLYGDINYKHLQIDSGAIFVGNATNNPISKIAHNAQNE